MNVFIRLVRFLFRPPVVHIPELATNGHHRCFCSHRRDDHLGNHGYCPHCTCAYFQRLEDAA